MCVCVCVCGCVVGIVLREPLPPWFQGKPEGKPASFGPPFDACPSRAHGLIPAPPNRSQATGHEREESLCERD